MKSRRSLPLEMDTLMPLLISVWRRIRKLAGPADVLQTREFRSVVAAAQKILQAELSGQNCFSDDEIAAASVLYPWPIHYQEGMSLLGELPQPPRRVLDLCSGTAPFAFAALRHGAQEVVAIDQNPLVLKLGAEICGRHGYALQARVADCLKDLHKLEGKFDLIILGHSLSTLFGPPGAKPFATIVKWIESLLARLTDDGYLLLVDSSLNDENRRLLQIRDTLVQQGVPVQAPCVWRGECPALKTTNSPCYAQRELIKPTLVKEIQRSAKINLSSLKMSYLLLRSPKAEWPKLPPHDMYRVVSPPIDTFHGKRYYLCGTDGKKTLGSHIVDHPLDSRAFEYLRRGELISFENALVQPLAIDIVEGTKVKVDAPCGKPLPENTGDSE